jgi:hypothetical protein
MHENELPLQIDGERPSTSGCGYHERCSAAAGWSDAGHPAQGAVVGAFPAAYLEADRQDRPRLDDVGSPPGRPYAWNLRAVLTSGHG